MTNTATETIDRIFSGQKEFFASGATLDTGFRKEMLRKLLGALSKWEKPLCQALWHDLHKSYEEAFMTEISIVNAEIKNHLAHVGSWSKRQRKHTPLKMFPSRSYIVSEPLGTALIVSPWNYPIQLLLNPLVGAISAGCTAVLKPSPYVPEVSLTVERMIKDTFPENYIAVVQGNRLVNGDLFARRFDIIFLTGSPDLAKVAMTAAAKNLTPMVLELGGKSPCIIDKEADIRKAAKRVAWGKTLNCGQTCIAPDYILIHKEVKDAFVSEFAKAVKELHGEDVSKTPHYVRMVSEKAFDRVTSYFSQGTVLCGGKSDRSERFIEPTLIDNPALDSPVMTEEIFGPVFPIITLDDEGKSFSEKVEAFVREREKPLAFYYFGNEKKGWEVIRHTTSGGACINDSIMHIANENIPFGGVGNSGMGHYHGRLSYEAFSHQRAVVKTTTLFDIPLRYMPYKMFKLVKLFL